MLVSGDHYGKRVCISGDGSTIAIASHHSDGTLSSQSDPGKVHIYTRTGNKWSQQVILQPYDVTASGHFGEGLSFSHDGTTLAIGAYNTTVTAYSNTYTNAGAVYVYSRSGRFIYYGVRFYTQYITDDSAAPGDISGTSAIQWNLVQTIIPPTGAHPYGMYIAIDEIGSTMALSAPDEDNNKGAVYVYTRSSGSVWTQETKLTSLDSGGSFGHDIQLSSDGTKLAIGQPTSSDSVYLYEKIDSEWIIKSKLTPSSTGIIPTAVANIGSPETYYGYSVSMTLIFQYYQV